MLVVQPSPMLYLRMFYKVHLCTTIISWYLNFAFSYAIFLIVGHSFFVACTCYLILILSVYFISEIITEYTSFHKLLIEIQYVSAMFYNN